MFILQNFAGASPPAWPPQRSRQKAALDQLGLGLAWGAGGRSGWLSHWVPRLTSNHQSESVDLKNNDVVMSRRVTLRIRQILSCFIPQFVHGTCIAFFHIKEICNRLYNTTNIHATIWNIPVCRHTGILKFFPGLRPWTPAPTLPGRSFRILYYTLLRSFVPQTFGVCHL